jgi:DNA-binding NarL/FixJ family response regulator
MDQKTPLDTTSRIVVVDDHPLMRCALRLTLSTQADLEVVGEAADGQQAVELCRRLHPDLVLMDVRMPGMDGLEATRQIKRELRRTIVLVLTASDYPDDLSEALEAGAAGYILKTAPTTQTLDAIRKVLAGESPLDQDVSTRLLMHLMEEAPKEERLQQEESLRGMLTPRETEVLTLTARGYTNLQMAHALRLSVSTVKKHLRGVISKLGVSDRTQAAVRAVELGVLTERKGVTPLDNTPSNAYSAPPRGDQKDHIKCPMSPYPNARSPLTLG